MNDTDQIIAMITFKTEPLLHTQYWMSRAELDRLFKEWQDERNISSAGGKYEARKTDDQQTPVVLIVRFSDILYIG